MVIDPRAGEKVMPAPFELGHYYSLPSGQYNHVGMDPPGIIPIMQICKRNHACIYVYYNTGYTDKDLYV